MNKIIIILIFLITSCSSLSVSMVKEGTFTLSSGILNETTWDEKLEFKRYSWFYELSMMYDLLITPISINSNYKRWFEKSEAISANNCSRFYIAAVFSSRDRRSNSNDIWNNFNIDDLQITNVNGFYRNLSFSSSYSVNSFNLYKFWGICVKNAGGEIPIEISIPGYKTQKILL